MIESLLRAASQRRAGPRPLRVRHPDVPPELEAVIMRCLAANPADRYPDAASLAIDLQAVADDAPLRTAREPWASRSNRWLRRNRLRVAVAVPLAMAPTVVAFGLAVAKLERARLTGQLTGQVKQLLREGKELIAGDQIVAAKARFATASDLAKESHDPGLLSLQAEARDRSRYADEIERIRQTAEQFFARLDPLKLRLLGFIGPIGDPSSEVEAALKPLYVLSNDLPWTKSPDLTLLNPERKAQLLDEVDTLLFLWSVSLLDLGTDEAIDRALGVCRKALRTTDEPAPWIALRARLAANRSPAEILSADRGFWQRPSEVDSSRACFLWGVLSLRDRQAGAAIDWLSRAIRLDVDQYWYHFYLGYVHQQAGDPAQALGHYDVAIALRSDLPWPRFNRARLYQARGAWSRALDDLDAALATTEVEDQPPIWLNLALVHESLGDFRSARDAYDALLETVEPDDPLARAARLNRARLDAEEGSLNRALAEYESLLDGARVSDPEALLGRAVIRLRQGRPAEALADLDVLLARDPRNPSWQTHRGEALLSLGRADEALEAVELALRLQPTPARERLRDRLAIAAGKLYALYLERPEDVLRLTPGGPQLFADLRKSAEYLSPASTMGDQLNRAVILSALGDHAGATAAAQRVLERTPDSIRARLVTARVLMRAGDRTRALDAIAAGLEKEPSEPRYLALRGEFQLGENPQAALADLETARRLGGGRLVHRTRARVLAALGRDEESVAGWTDVLREDPEDALAYLERARSLHALGLWDQSLADLEKAATWADRRPELLARITWLYARCLPARPAHLPRVCSLTCRTIRFAVPESARVAGSILVRL